MKPPDDSLFALPTSRRTALAASRTSDFAVALREPGGPSTVVCVLAFQCVVGYSMAECFSPLLPASLSMLPRLKNCVPCDCSRLPKAQLESVA